MGPQGDTGPTGPAGPAIGGILTTKGDLAVHDGTTTVRLPVGGSGQLLVPDATQTSGWRFTTARMLEGAGRPEGVVAAPVGSQYIDTAATTGALSWVKAFGTGTTGWRVKYGDTNWRNLNALQENGWAWTQMRIRRRNFLIEMYLEGLGADDAKTAAAFYTPPSGFRLSPGSTLDEVRHARLLAANDFFQINGASGKVEFPGALLLQPTFQVLRWSTDDLWPATLPGTPL
jgi:hypothetical protein